MSFPQNTTQYSNQPPPGKESLCTLSTCPVSRSIFKYQPILSYNSPILALFALITIGHLVLGIRYRTWPFMAAMVIGTLLETLGYFGRTMGHFNPFKEDWYMIQITVLTFAPAFFCAAIYMSLSRIVTVHGEQISRIRPVWYTRIFVTFDIISLGIQGSYCFSHLPSYCINDRQVLVEEWLLLPATPSNRISASMSCSVLLPFKS